MATRAAVITVEAKKRELAERMLGDAFNTWMDENGRPEVVHFFEPVRVDRRYGDYTYDTYHTTMTFFYRVPGGLREL